MRDTIKSKEYFDEYILKMSEGIKRFEEGIAAGKYLNDKILFVKDYILQKKIGIIIAKYSKGDSIEEIKKEFESSLDLFGEAWDDSVYESNIIFASLSSIFIISCLPKLELWLSKDFFIQESSILSSLVIE